MYLNTNYIYTNILQIQMIYQYNITLTIIIQFQTELKLFTCYFKTFFFLWTDDKTWKRQSIFTPTVKTALLVKFMEAAVVFI